MSVYELLRSENRMAIVRSVRTDPGISRATLATRLGLTKAAVGQLVEGLIEEGWLADRLPANSAVRGRPGRPLMLGTKRFVFLGASFNETRCQVVARTLAGKVIDQAAEAVTSPDFDAVTDQLARLVDRTHQRLGKKDFKVCGLGVGAPGPVHKASGVLRYSQRTGWRDAPVRDALETAMGRSDLPALPIIVERGVGCIALHQFETQQTKSDEPLLYLQIGHSIALAIAGRAGLHDGHRGLAGTISHMTVVPDGPVCECGRRGCANVTVTLAAIERDLEMPAQQVFELAANGRQDAIAAVRHTGALLGTLIRNLCLLYDPAQVLIGGPAIQPQSILVSAVQETLHALCDPLTMPAPALTAMQLPDTAVASGAAVALIDWIVGGRT